MFFKDVFVTLLLGTLLAAVLGRAVNPDNQKSLTLVSQYKRNSLQDVSSDGNLLLFYETSKPVRTYTIPLTGGKASANQPDAKSDVLRIVERASGRELGRTGVGFFPTDVQFIPGSQRLFFKEPATVDGRLEWRIKIWDPASGEARECSGANVMSESFYVVDGQHVLSIMRRQGKGESFAILALPDCSQAN